MAEKQDSEVLAYTLADGFSSLLEQAKSLSAKEKELQVRLNFAYNEYLKLVTEISDYARPDKHDIALKILNGDPEEGRVEIHTPDSAWLEKLPCGERGDKTNIEIIAKGMEACKLVNQQRPSKSKPRFPNGCPVVHNPAPMNTCPVVKDQKASLDGCPVISSMPTNVPELESDFTTPGGVKGNLQCPYARVVQNRDTSNLMNSNRNLPTPPIEDGGLDAAIGETDPIKAEFNQDRLSSPPASATASNSKCPIRFLKQHSPEEVAQYFENHKHEVPRSHAICVRRYQKDATSIRQLDNKYGNLVSMIQGLGAKHQPYLSTKDREGGSVAQTSSERVSRWAENVSSRSQSHVTEETEEPPRTAKSQTVDDDRTGRFERPLREVRVGESPSRPWGIPVPHQYKAPRSAILSPEPAPVAPHLSKDTPITTDAASVVTPVPRRLHANVDSAANANPPKGKCPFSGMQKDTAATRPHHETAPDPTTQQQPPCPGEQDKSQTRQPNTRGTTPMASKQPDKSPTPSQMVFNGPVFFGYSPEQTMAFLQQIQGRQAS